MQLEAGDWPLFGWITDIRPALSEARAEGKTVVIGTLVHVVGSTPRPAGSQMLFKGDQAVGYFSGGCLEADIANHAEMVLADGEPRLLTYGQGSPWIDIRLLCGGRLDILLERIAPDEPAVTKLLSLREQRQRIRWTSDGKQREVDVAGPDEPAMAYADGRYSLCLDPEWRLLLAGSDPISLAIAQLGALSGFAPTIIRPDGPSTSPPMEGVNYVRDAAVTALPALHPDRWTAVIAASHDEDADDAVLIEALKTDAAYVGVLGAIKRAAIRRERLLEAGLSAAQVERLHAPIGIGYCGKAPWEVAVSVMAEIMQLRTATAGLPKGH